MTNETENQKDNVCRLCGGTLDNLFTGKVLGKYVVSYYKCSHCHSAQTENPHWLDEAYSQQDYNLDTGALQRNLTNFAACYTLSKILSANKVVDFGGKDGILCRFLRDHLIECFVCDKYSRPNYTPDFELNSRTNNVDMVLAFEVFEHFANPKADLDEIFSFQPNYIVATTELYANQGNDWWYFTQETGQHVFFYSAQAINLIAQKYGYAVALVGAYILFYKTDIPNIQNKIISLQSALTGWIFQAIKSYIFLLPTPGVTTDYNFVLSKLTQPQL
jgi:hypothetical protein